MEWECDWALLLIGERGMDCWNSKQTLLAAERRGLDILISSDGLVLCGCKFLMHLSELWLYNTMIDGELMSTSIELVLGICLFALVSCLGGIAMELLGMLSGIIGSVVVFLGSWVISLKVLNNWAAQPPRPWFIQEAHFRDGRGRFSANQIVIMTTIGINWMQNLPLSPLSIEATLQLLETEWPARVTGFCGIS